MSQRETFVRAYYFWSILDYCLIHEIGNESDEKQHRVRVGHTINSIITDVRFQLIIVASNPFDFATSNCIDLRLRFPLQIDRNTTD